MKLPSVSTVANHLGRITGAMALSIVTLAMYAWLLSVSSFVRQFTLFAIPISVLAGVLPLIYWYKRDAYPIGLAYCVVAFFVLRKCAELLERLPGR